MRAAASQLAAVPQRLVGCGPLWLRGCHQVEAAYASGEWLSLEGEPGTGKLAVLRAVHRHRNPVGAAGLSIRVTCRRSAGA
jgi:transcriptional regulator with AAA-type ATPase domain